MGVASAPALRRRWWASRGEGAFADGGPIRVSEIARLEDAVVSFATSGLRRHPQAVLELVGRAWHARTLSDFWQHMLVAEGSADVAVEHEVNLWDLAAVQVIVEEAGGRFSDLGGVPRADGGSAVSTNGLLHEAALAALDERA